MSLKGKENDVRKNEALGFDYSIFFLCKLGKNKQYYKLLILLKATLPKNASTKLQENLNIDLERFE